MSSTRTAPLDRPLSLAMPPSVNFHLWEPCNMACRFCFASFADVKRTVLPKGHLDRGGCLAVSAALGACFKKVTFAGGEAMLCPWLADVIRAAKAFGATTMLVTNGSRIDEEWLASMVGILDWIALSIDSAVPHTNVRMGRAVRGRALSAEDYILTADRVRNAGLRLKVNTVVNAFNVTEDLSPLIERLLPERWKLLRMLPVAGQNDGAKDLLIDGDQFRALVDRHAKVERVGIRYVPEDNADMRGSYGMVDPAGRFFDNASGGHRYGPPILEVGIERAWSAVAFDAAAFARRGGVYNWESQP